LLLIAEAGRIDGENPNVEAATTQPARQAADERFGAAALKMLDDVHDSKRARGGKR
jgi:hypothetical protein